MNKPLLPTVAGSPRGRLIEDMSLRGFAAKTGHCRIRIVPRFAERPGRSSDAATAADLRLGPSHHPSAFAG